MTQTVRRIPGQRADVRRPGIVYAYTTLKVDAAGLIATGADAGTEEGYAGKTVQKLSARDDQHRGIVDMPDGTPARCQPWSDLIVGAVRIVERGMWTEAELADRERFWIEQMRPRYNFEFNGDNPHRVPIFEARRQRDERDRVAGRTPRAWAPQPARVRRAWPVARMVLSSPWTRWLASWAALVILLAMLLAWAADKVGQDLTPQWRSGLAVILAAVLVGRVWWWLRGRKMWRRWKRRR